MTLEQLCETLSEDEQISLAIELINISFPIWKEFAQSNTLSYRDTVVGLKHNVPKELLDDTISEIENYLSTSAIIRKAKHHQSLLKLFLYYKDPVVALQDIDWELPYIPERIFYSVYNLIRSIVETDLKVFTISVSINQAIHAIQTAGLLTDDEIRKILDNAQNGSNKGFLCTKEIEETKK
ncbi:MAG TPA: hypothetical protein VHB70_11790 [Parafilimonas sp.]|nr:hypothetical protein [Parafilimonas sp.]